MNKIFSIPKNLVFSPCRVDGQFWSQFHTLLSYLGNPEDLVALKQEDSEAYATVVEPFIRFIAATEEELFNKGHITETALEDQTS